MYTWVHKLTYGPDSGLQTATASQRHDHASDAEVAVKALPASLAAQSLCRKRKYTKRGGVPVATPKVLFNVLCMVVQTLPKPGYVQAEN